MTDITNALKRLKRQLMQVRLCGPDTLATYKRACGDAEADIEELLANSRWDECSGEPKNAAAEEVLRREEAENERRAALAASPASSAPEAPDAELHFNATRLRNVARLVGLENAVPEDDATLDGARGSVLGMIASKLRAAGQDERAAFEAWVKNAKHPEGGYVLTTIRSGTYQHPDTRCAWRGWQARASLSGDKTDKTLKEQ